MARHSVPPSRPTPEFGYDDLLQVRHGVTGGKQISLVARGSPRHGFVLERHRRAPGEPHSIQRIDARDRAALAEFVAQDPYAAQLGDEYRAVLDALAAAADGPAEAAGPAGGQGSPGAPGASGAPAPAAPRAPERLPAYASECESDAELITLMRRITGACGAVQCFFHWFVYDERSGEVAAHHLLIGGDPAWAQQYVDRHWYLNDPAVAHAHDDTRPLRGSSLVMPSGHWLNRHGPLHGMRSHQFHPAHRRDVATIGVLHVSTAAEPPGGEEVLWAHRRPLRGLANELLEWQVLRRRRELAATLSLEARELQALRLVARGGSARHVAAELGIAERAAYQLFTAINRKLDSEHIKVSANKARQLGLLGDGYIQE
ncbi:helix-turn-helix transcriptional regulator [Burkholderia plantarii]|uniref:Putative transcriptional regulator n=1 Tax=Burkholderia plantarii TaxID=41899 RepID=A0A0B6S4Z0_BURPL|nr:autoinducer binding domain-containing protein [Burkholderia plantarii]AJK48340.1 putative transcriptional regulator [Burkholderia plantarii]WLE61636.1 autoinducer binding domain-containing protein [Burkholderia plantarii]